MLKSQHEEQYVIDVKDCYNAPDHLKMVGCLKITSDMPGGVSIYFSSMYSYQNYFQRKFEVLFRLDGTHYIRCTH